MIWVIHSVSVILIYFLSKKLKNIKLFFLLTFIYTLFVFGQRWMTGEDFGNYLIYYLTDFQGEEIGYFFLQDLFSHFNLYFGLLIFLVLFITMANNLFFISKTKRNIALALFLFMFSEMYFFQMSQIRQFVAVGFFINAYYFAYKKDSIKSIILFLLAVSFHQSAFFLLPVLLIKIKLKRKYIFLILILFVFLPLINIQFLLTLPIFNQYNSYLNTIYNVPLGAFHYFRFYISLILGMYFVYKIKPFDLKNHDKMLFSGIILYFLIYGLSFKFAPLFRMTNYFRIFEILFFVNYYPMVRGIASKLLKKIIVFFYLAIYIGIAITDSASISDYQFRHLRLYENRSNTELNNELYYNNE